ncbi:MAG: hypothetical protein IH946_02895, partial [Bacteroidetes bacterium]|nr:hypothetical protein [Bacteroidota bacterium]
FFKQYYDERLAVAGGQLGEIEGRIYLVCGHRFDGPYSTVNLDTFTQQYTDQIRSFDIIDTGSTLSILNYSAEQDTANLHRRDFNLVPQVFADGHSGYTIFTGVFQHKFDIPWLNTVDLDSTGYTVNNNFNQFLSQYHSAKVPLYDPVNQEMHTFFFGGMSMYKYDSIGGNLVEDDKTPFVNTISRVTRYPNDSMAEYQLPVEMPALVGSGAEFIINDTATFYSNDIIEMDTTLNDTTFIGYIYGGIQSAMKNIFLSSDSS